MARLSKEAKAIKALIKELEDGLEDVAQERHALLTDFEQESTRLDQRKLNMIATKASLVSILETTSNSKNPPEEIEQ